MRSLYESLTKENRVLESVGQPQCAEDYTHIQAPESLQYTVSNLQKMSDRTLFVSSQPMREEES